MPGGAWAVEPLQLSCCWSPSQRWFTSGAAGLGAAFTVEFLGAQCRMSLERSTPSPVGRQQGLCVDIWK